LILVLTFRGKNNLEIIIFSLASINLKGNDFILAFPSKVDTIKKLGNLTIQLYNRNKTVNIKAHLTMLGHI